MSNQESRSPGGVPLDSPGSAAPPSRPSASQSGPPPATDATPPQRQTNGGDSPPKSLSPAGSGASKKKPPAKRSARRGSTSSVPPVRSLPAVEGVRVKSRPPESPASQSSQREPAWLRRIHKDLPPYTDEMLGFLLIGVGLLSFLTLLSPESGEIGTAWSGVLRRLFGLGSYAISGVIVAGGAVLLVPKLGIPIRVDWWRLTISEVAFVLLLAYIHAGIRASVGGDAGRIEAFAQAMEGHGGGLVGWAIQDLLHMLLGDVITGILLLALLVISAALLGGVQRQHLTDNLTRLQEWFLSLAERWEPRLPPEPVHFDPGASGGDGTSHGDPAGPRVIELPSIPGRPSIVTGQRGAGAAVLLRPGAGAAGRTPFNPDRSRPSTRIERLKARYKSGQVKHRFELEEIVDRKRTRKRSDRLPPLESLDNAKFDRPSNEEINLSAAIIEETVEDFGMQVEVVGVKAGPTVTQYAVTPITEVVGEDGKKTVQRVRVTHVAALAKDLALALSAPSVRIQAPVPGTNYIGIEVPNAQPGIVSLRPVIESEQFYRIHSPLALALGREVDGTPYAADLSKMPHLLIGGTTGSGKSVCLRSIATCLVANNRPDQLRLIMIDPKMVELVRFNGLPHLLGHVEVKLDRIIGVLRWVTREMDRRYRLMEEVHARNIDIYNRGRHHRHRMPRIVVLIDELAELMTEFPDETEHLITRLAQMARATGIHLVVATQRPSTDVVTGLIKANFPARIAFAVASGVDSRVIIDAVGAEDLIGRGDMLYQSPEAAAPIRLQGCFVSDSEMERIVDFWHENWREDEEEQSPWERSLTRQAIIEETDEMLEEAIRIVQQEREASASQLQRKLNVGYPRAGRIIDALHRLGVVGPEESGGRTREVLIKPDEDPIDYIMRNRRGKL